MKEILKQLAEYLAIEAVKRLIVSYLKKLIGITTGFWGFAVGYILNKLYAWGLLEVKKQIVREEVEDKNEQILERYEKVINNPDASQSDIDSATLDYLGARVRPIPESNTKRP